MIKLDILSDIACPWCYVGKAYLDRALEARADHPFTVEWHPFQLDPTIPPGGLDRRAYLEARFGGRDGVVRAHLPLLEHAKAAGIELNYDRMERSPNTLDAHRLIHWAGLERLQTPMVGALFKAYWRDGRDIGDAATLAEIAGETGLDRDLIRRLLASDNDRDLIRAREAHARERGVNAVPTFVVANQHVLSGAQSVETWTGLIEEIERQLTGDDDA